MLQPCCNYKFFQKSFPSESVIVHASVILLNGGVKYVYKKLKLN